MASTTAKIHPAYAVTAFGFELRLWKESEEIKWGATIQDNTQILNLQIEADNATVAKVELLFEARNHAVSLHRQIESPLESFAGAWQEITTADTS